MRILAALVGLFVLFTAWHYLRREENENRLALVASQLAHRDVDVGCPGFWTKLVEITPYAGWVAFDEHGQPSDKTHLAAKTCASLERLWRAGEPPSFSCLLTRSCERERLELVDGMLTLAHESWHLRGVKDEARTQCYAVQSMEATARLFELLPADARLVALYVAVQDAAAPRDRYHSRECRPGGAFDLAPATAGWPG
jgi:hypothetical protein